MTGTCGDPTPTPLGRSAAPVVSVVVPVHNADSTLSSALESILSQTRRDFELIAIDDGSTDGTARLLADFARRDSRVRLLQPGRVGLVGALNEGLSAARGQYVARFDADDFAHPDRLAEQTAYLEAHPEIAVVGSLVECFSEDAEVGEGFRVYEAWINSLVDPDAIAREIFVESPLVHPSVTFRRDTVCDAGGYRDTPWPEDYELWLRLHTAGCRFAKVPRVLHRWREHESRLTRTDPRYSVENFLRVKAHYLRRGPLAGDPRAVIWGAGQFGRRISKHLQSEGVDLLAFVDIDPKKIGNTRRGAPIVSPDALLSVLSQHGDPLVLAAVPSRGARDLIRQRLAAIGLVEGVGFFCVA